MKSYRLSKSKFLSAFQCEKKLWLEIHDKDKATPISEVQKSVFDQGHYVGELAQTYFPGGFLIESDYLDIPLGIKNTLSAIKANPKSIYEGFFQYDDVLVRPDILKNNNDGTWDFIEVKSSTKLKPENIRDVAIQTYVLQGSDIKINKSYLMHINTDCEYPDLSNLFTLVDLTSEIEPFISNMNLSIENLRKMLSQSIPDIHIGKHCTKPYNCDFRDYCWKDLPDYSIFNIPGIYTSKKEELYKSGTISIDDLSSDYILKDKEKRFIDSYKLKSPIINRKAIASELSALEYPLYFVDFETYGSAVPEFEGLSPYNQYPFQFSCHILDDRNNLEHAEYLHYDKTDPREPLIIKLIETLKDKGTIVAYNASFEKGVINKLSEKFPKYKEELGLINRRFWDQLVIFKKFYTDYRFKGSNSLKSVLPVLIPNLKYSDLDIQDGSQAQVGWRKMISAADDKEKQKLYNQLLEYCKLDTLAMVEIQNFLKNLSI